MEEATPVNHGKFAVKFQRQLLGEVLLGGAVASNLGNPVPRCLDGGPYIRFRGLHEFKTMEQTQ